MSLKCPFCKNAVAGTVETFRQNYINFNRAVSKEFSNHDIKNFDLNLNKLNCPNCDKTSYTLQGIGDEYKYISLPVHPASNAQILPEYVPSVLRNDYEEAYSIVHLSPKASATLSRRCLQGMIRDFFDISKSSLHDEINAIKDSVSGDQKMYYILYVKLVMSGLI